MSNTIPTKIEHAGTPTGKAKPATAALPVIAASAEFPGAGASRRCAPGTNSSAPGASGYASNIQAGNRKPGAGSSAPAPRPGTKKRPKLEAGPANLNSPAAGRIAPAPRTPPRDRPSSRVGEPLSAGSAGAGSQPSDRIAAKSQTTFQQAKVGSAGACVADNGWYNFKPGWIGPNRSAPPVSFEATMEEAPMSSGRLQSLQKLTMAVTVATSLEVEMSNYAPARAAQELKARRAQEVARAAQESEVRRAQEAVWAARAAARAARAAQLVDARRAQEAARAAQEVAWAAQAAARAARAAQLEEARRAQEVARAAQEATWAAQAAARAARAAQLEEARRAQEVAPAAERQAKVQEVATRATAETPTVAVAEPANASGFVSAFNNVADPLDFSVAAGPEMFDLKAGGPPAPAPRHPDGTLRVPRNPNGVRRNSRQRRQWFKGLPVAEKALIIQAANARAAWCQELKMVKEEARTKRWRLKDEAGLYKAN